MFLKNFVYSLYRDWSATNPSGNIVAWIIIHIPLVLWGVLEDQQNKSDPEHDRVSAFFVMIYNPSVSPIWLCSNHLVFRPSVASTQSFPHYPHLGCVWTTLCVYVITLSASLVGLHTTKFSRDVWCQLPLQETTSNRCYFQSTGRICSISSPINSSFKIVFISGVTS